MRYPHAPAWLCLACAIYAFLPSCGTSTPVDTGLPTTATDQVADDYHGTLVQDPYRWLEDQDGPRTADWVAAQNRYTQAFFDRLPRAELRQRTKELFDYERFSPPQKHGEYWYLWHNTGLQNQSVLYREQQAGARDTVVLDPNTLSEDGTVAVTGLSFSKDGRYLAYALSAAGSDWKEWRVLDLQTLQPLEDRVRWCKFSGATWQAGNEGFWYLRYPAPKEGETFQQQNEAAQLCFHTIGEEQAKDKIAYERKDQPRWSFGAQASDDGQYLVITIRQGTDARKRVIYMDLQKDHPVVEPLFLEFDASYAFLGNDADRFYFLTDKDAERRRIVSVGVGNPDKLTEVVPQADQTLESARIVGNNLLLTYLQDASHRVEVRELSGAKLRDIPLPGIGSVSAFTGKRKDDVTTFAFSSFTTPPTIYAHNLTNGATAKILEPKTRFDPSGYVTRQVFFQSRDGIRLAMFLTHRKGLALNGKHATYLYGYGGFNISIKPGYRPETLAWLDMGGVYAQVTLRGGGEYGRAWHEAGMLQRKQTVFDDFIAAAEYLIRNGYTSNARLAIGGRSNGGLLVGAILTQRPDLIGAAIPEVGVMDMLRYHKFTIGHAWIPEYGSSDDKDMFKVLHAYSPLHNIEQDFAYPPTLIMTGDHDDRVLPGHSYKFAAALQAAQAGTNPILIRIDTDAGHGSGKPVAKRIDEAVDRWAFLVWALTQGSR